MIYHELDGFASSVLEIEVLWCKYDHIKIIKDKCKYVEFGFISLQIYGIIHDMLITLTIIIIIILIIMVIVFQKIKTWYAGNNSNSNDN